MRAEGTRKISREKIAKFKNFFVKMLTIVLLPEQALEHN
jgi:hypothetical protein